MCMCNEYFWCLEWHMSDKVWHGLQTFHAFVVGVRGSFACVVYMPCMVCGVYYVLGCMACVVYVIGMWHVCCMSYVHIICGEIWGVCTRGQVNACKVGVHVRCVHMLCVCVCVCVMYIKWWACVLSGRGWMVGVQGEYAMWCVWWVWMATVQCVCLCVCVLLYVHT